MTQPRHAFPLPLGDDGLPYSKGLMARALITVGVTADRAYELARRLEVDLAERDARTVDPDRLVALGTTLGTLRPGRSHPENLRTMGRTHLTISRLDLPSARF